MTDLIDEKTKEITGQQEENFMSEDAGKIVATIIVTTLFWVMFMVFVFINSNSREIDNYRQGYAECKMGMNPRYDKNQGNDAGSQPSTGQ